MCSVASLTGQTSFCLPEEWWPFCPPASLLCPITENWASNPQRAFPEGNFNSSWIVLYHALKHTKPNRNIHKKTPKKETSAKKTQPSLSARCLKPQRNWKRAMGSTGQWSQPGSLWHPSVVTESQLWLTELWASPFSLADITAHGLQGSLASIWQHRRSQHLSADLIKKYLKEWNIKEHPSCWSFPSPPPFVTPDDGEGSRPWRQRAKLKSCNSKKCKRALQKRRGIPFLLQWILKLQDKERQLLWPITQAGVCLKGWQHLPESPGTGLPAPHWSFHHLKWLNPHFLGMQHMKVTAQRNTDPVTHNV